MVDLSLNKVVGFVRALFLMCAVLGCCELYGNSIDPTLNRRIEPKVPFTNFVEQIKKTKLLGGIGRLHIIAVEHHYYPANDEWWSAQVFEDFRGCLRWFVLSNNDNTLRCKSTNYDTQFLRKSRYFKPTNDISEKYEQLRKQIPSCGVILGAYWNSHSDLWTFFGIEKFFKEGTNHVWMVVDQPIKIGPRIKDVEVDVDV